MNWHWPHDPTNRFRRNYVPWYVILWRVPWFCLGFVFRVGFVFCMGMSHGSRGLRDAWEDTK